MKTIKFNTYTINARILPAIISIIPFFILWFYIRSYLGLKDLEKFLLNIKFYGEITLSIAAIYFCSLIIRQLSKYFESKYFIHADGFPTTFLMTYSDNTFSKEYKDKYRSKIKEQFDISLLNEEEEKSNYIEAKKLLNEATKQVILKIKDGYLVKHHNIWYGFYRNFIGGTIISMVICLANIVTGLFINTNLTIISSALFIVYLLIFLFRKKILFGAAIDYAKQLIAEFMQKE